MAEWIERYRLPVGLVLAAILILGVAAFLTRRPEAHPIEIITPTRAPEAPRALKVHVTGEVANPGVYTLAEGDRVEDAVRAAGGAKPEADLIRLNLAVRVQDQMQVYVPPKSSGQSAEQSGGESNSAVPSADTTAPSPHSRININTATAAELDTLPSIGPVTAQRIISHRQQNGPFQRIEQLKEAKVVNASTFEKIKDLITAP